MPAKAGIHDFFTPPSFCAMSTKGNYPQITQIYAEDAPKAHLRKSA
jgi:hypothetical protein